MLKFQMIFAFIFLIIEERAFKGCKMEILKFYGLMGIP
jgi:hypothetical protein